jgi:hypothetical protein
LPDEQNARNFKEDNRLKTTFLLVIIMMLLFSPHASAQKQSNSGWDFRTEEVQAGGGYDMEAFTIDVPEDWDFDAELAWHLDNVPVFTIFFDMKSEDGTWQLTCIPAMNYVWYTDPLIQRYIPEGSAYDSLTLVLEPMDADDFLEDNLIPYMLENAETDIRHFDLIDIEESDELEEFYDYIIDPGDLDFYDLESAIATMEYEEDGEDVEAKLAIVMGYHEAEMIGIGSNQMETVTYWTMMLCILEKTPVGELNDTEDIYWDILTSIRWNSDFLEEYQEEHDEYFEDVMERQHQQQEEWEETFLGN